MKRTVFKVLATLVLLGVVLGVAGAGGAYWYFTRDLPVLETLHDYRPSIITTVYSYDGRIIGEFAIERRQVVSYDEIPPVVVQAFIASEDQTFFQHKGVDYKGILRAAWANLRAGRIREGASTITMQVSRTFFLTRKRELSRKIREALLALKMEHTFTKEEILMLYLNQIYLGEGAYGVAEAARTYFGKPVKAVTLPEAALLAGLPAAPSRYSPFKNMEIATARKNRALREMAKMQFITPAQMQAAINTELVFSKYASPTKAVTPYFTEHVRRYLEQKYGDETLYREGLAVFTTVDIEKTQLAQRAIQDGLHAVDARQGFRGPLKCLLSDAERTAYLTEQKFAQAPRPQPGDIIPAVITEVDKTGIRVALPGGAAGLVEPASLALIDKVQAASPRFKACKRKASGTLRVGDVIEVRIAAAPETGSYDVALTQTPEVQSALLSVELPTGAVRAMVGGYDFNRSQFNRAVQARRQPGSGFKPIIYTAGIDYGFTPASSFLDAPIIYENALDDEERQKDEKGELDEDEKYWKPKNYGGTFSGELTLAHGLAHSKNIVTIKLFQRLGVDYARDYAYKMGIQTPLSRDSTLALGSTAIPMTELVTAYGTIATGGRKVPPLFVTKVFSRDGTLIEDHLPESLGARGLSLTNTTRDAYLAIVRDPAQRALLTPLTEPGEQVISPQTAFVTTSMMEGVIERGTGFRAKSLGRPLAGKTGTTDDNRDAWFTGFSPRVLTSVWVGYDRMDRSLGPGETGSKAALPIWIQYMDGALADDPIEEFTPPEGIEFYEFDDNTGTVPGPESRRVVTCAFKEGTAPRPRGTSIIPTDFLQDEDAFP